MTLAIRNGKLVTAGGRAHGRHQRGVMNATEAAFFDLQRRRAERGEIIGASFETHTLALAGGAVYTPDVPVVELDHSKTFYEVKASKLTEPTKRFPLGNRVPVYKEAAIVRIKIAAALYPQHRFVMVWRDGPWVWMEKVYGAGYARNGGGA